MATIPESMTTALQLHQQGRLQEAEQIYHQILLLQPNHADALHFLGMIAAQNGRPGMAIDLMTRSIALSCNVPAFHSNLGKVHKDLGDIEQTISCYRRALELNPEDAEAHSKLLLHLGLGFSSEQSIHDEHCRWNERHALPLAQFIQPHLNHPRPERRLRIGYVSPDFYNHPVGRFMRPLLESHDHENFDIVCYSDAKNTDSNTDHCRAQTNLWRDIQGLSNEQLDQIVRQDRIDILVDLAMHTAGNRLLLFARKPAPVQVTYLAYPGTTGLKTIDYRITDSYLDPPGQDDRYYSEKSVRLPETYWCYPPPPEAPPVCALPALENRYITFGCLNNYCKVNSPTFKTWGALLNAVQNARLLLHARPGAHRDRVRSLLSEQGIAPERLMFVDSLPLEKYFQSYHQIDLALDPFPCGGGTTTCDALWMGVPVVSMAGQRAVGRGGLSILSNLGMPELVAQNVEQYVQIAANLASDLPRLSRIRMGLRDQMLASPLMDAPRFARNVETAYREMWHRWCTK